MDLKSLEIKVSRSENLPMLSQVVNSVLKLAEDPNVSARQLEQIIQRDPALCAKVLKVANSAYYGGGQAPTIARAVSVLGIGTLRTLTISAAFQQMIAARPLARMFCKVEFWRHSLGVATAAKVLAKIKAPHRADELYTAGMMHDIGLLVLERFCPAELDQAYMLAQSENMPLHKAEKMLYGFDHCVLGGMLAERWNLSALVMAAVRFHHEPILDSQFRETTIFVNLADTLAHQCGLTNSLPSVQHDLAAEYVGQVGIPEEQFDPLKLAVVQEVMRAQEAFHIK